MIPIRNVSGNARLILMCLIPILVGVISDGFICSKTPCKGLAPINEVKEVQIHVRFNIGQECA